MIEIDLLDENQALIKTLKMDSNHLDDEIDDLRIFLKSDEYGLRARTLQIRCGEKNSIVDANITNTLRSISGYFWAKAEFMKMLMGNEE